VIAWALALALSAAAAALLVAWLQQRARNADLERQIDAATEELQRLQQACARLAPAGVVNRLVADGVSELGEMPAQRKVVTALFVDLVGYTAMSERLDPALLARVLNGYFQRMSDAIHEHRGHVSTFLATASSRTSVHCSPTRGRAPTQCEPRWRCARRWPTTTASSSARDCRR